MFIASRFIVKFPEFGTDNNQTDADLNFVSNAITSGGIVFEKNRIVEMATCHHSDASAISISFPDAFYIQATD